jgi:hypothetical protein
LFAVAIVVRSLLTFPDFVAAQSLSILFCLQLALIATRNDMQDDGTVDDLTATLRFILTCFKALSVFIAARFQFWI